MDDLRYLAQHAPECFEKTCKNVIYNIPETKPILEPAASESVNPQSKEEPIDRQNIEVVLENLKRLEANDFPIANVDAEEVKSLLGNLYMELLFPHNDQDTFMSATGNRSASLFDRKI